jgi:class 3 adenylate cyclase
MSAGADADVAGYSRLMGRNEEETVRELEAHQALILPLIAKHGGSIVNIAGDGIVAQFPSAVRFPTRTGQLIGPLSRKRYDRSARANPFFVLTSLRSA